MSQPAIKVEGLWKEYVVGTEQDRHGTFYDLLANAIKSPFKRLRQLGGESAEADRFWALRDVNFEVQPGEVLGIIGRNGAGKSTLLKVLSRITAPTRGRVTVKGRMASLLEVGTGFHPELSGRENIFLNGALLGMSRADIASKFDEIVAFSEIAKFIDTPVKRYSSGMYMRLAFSVSAHLDPDILLVDEVLAVGDAEFQQKCLGRMAQSRLEGRTILFVSHNTAAIQMLCSRVLLVERGQVRNIGAPAEIVNEYLSLGGGTTGTADLDTGHLRLLAVEAAAETTEIEGTEIELSFRLACLRPISDLLIDFCLENADGVRLAHIMPNARGEQPLLVEAGTEVEYRLRMQLSALAPGSYRAALHAFSAKREGPLLSQSNIPLFRVPAATSAPECAAEHFTGVLIPRYSSSLSLAKS